MQADYSAYSEDSRQSGESGWTVVWLVVVWLAQALVERLVGQNTPPFAE